LVPNRVVPESEFYTLKHCEILQQWLIGKREKGARLAAGLSIDPNVAKSNVSTDLSGHTADLQMSVTAVLVVASK